jgi:glycerol-3-phosphate dehydrogenase
VRSSLAATSGLSREDTVNLRSERLSELATGFDLVVIGGGITGAGAARDAARRGLRVCLVDQDDLASGTSSRSSKLVHGGLRYLEQLEFSLVFEAVTERRVLMEIAPHLVHPLGFVFPVYKSSRRGVFTVNLGMWVYDSLSLFRSPRIHRNLSKKQVQKEEPMLLQRDLKGAPLYYDCSTDDARLTLETALDAQESGAVILNHMRVTSLIRDPDGRTSGVAVCDQLTGDVHEIKTHAVINATGPWSDRTRSLRGTEAPDRLRPTKGIHVVVDAERLRVHHAVVCFHPVDGRVLFAIPWGERTYIGTTDTDFSGDPAEVRADRADIRYLLDAANHYFPDAKLVDDDVISTWAGVRPLIAEESDGNESSVSREHEIRIDADGLITIAGGKLTTYRRMSAEVVDKAVGLLMLMGRSPDRLEPARTDSSPLPGGVGWPEDDDPAPVVARTLEAGSGRISEKTAMCLVQTYGTRALDVATMAAKDTSMASPLVEGRPEIMAQVRFAVQSELAERLSDVMIRRTQLFYRCESQGLRAAEAISREMTELLEWSEDRRLEEVALYRAEVERSRLWQTD